MKESRATSFEYVVQDEGSALRSDRQDTTVYGLTQKDIYDWTGKKLLRADLLEFDAEQAKGVYLYMWNYNALDAFPAGLDYFVFDSGLVCGFTTVRRWLALSLLPGVAEPSVERAAEMVRDLEPGRSSILIAQLEFNRRRRGKAQPGWLTYGQMWTNRINRVQKRSLQMHKKLVMA